MMKSRFSGGNKWCVMLLKLKKIVPRGFWIAGRSSARLCSTGLMTAGIDHTERMQTWIDRKLDILAEENLVAFIFKTKSPSSGMRKVKIYNDAGQTISYAGIGIFARSFMERFPDIPVEDEGRLNDPVLREKFIETIFVLQRWRQAVKSRTVKDLVDFHSKHKYTLMAHSPEKLKLLGRLIAHSCTMN